MAVVPVVFLLILLTFIGVGVHRRASMLWKNPSRYVTAATPTTSRERVSPAHFARRLSWDRGRIGPAREVR